DFVEGDVKHRTLGLAQVMVSDGGGDADDLVERLVRAACKGTANRVLPGEEGLNKSFVDDGGTRRSVLKGKVAAGSERDLHRREPARGNVQEKGGSRTGSRSVDVDVAVDSDAPEKRPA